MNHICQGEEMFGSGNCIGAMRTLAALALVIGSLSACGDIFSRDDFANIVKDKTSDEVASKLGKPSATDESDPSRVAWIYHHVTFEAGATSKRDADTIVVFNRQANGKLKVAEVNYR
jgi:hypothetical protein